MDKILFTPLSRQKKTSTKIFIPRLSYLQDAWQRFRSNRVALFFLGVLFSLFLLAILGPQLSGYRYDTIHLEKKNLTPCWEFWFGSDDLGRDLFCRVCSGAQISLSIGIIAASVDALIGVTWGAFSAHFGGIIDEIMMRICDVLYAIPPLLTVILLTMFMGSGFWTILLALTLTGWINMARITRSQILQVKQSDFVAAASLSGASSLRIVFRHLIPNALGPILATLTLTIPASIFTEAFLSFLGLGFQPPLASWGIMIHDGVTAMEIHPWRLLFPSIALSLTMLSFNLIGNALRDALDPRLRS